MHMIFLDDANLYLQSTPNEELGVKDDILFNVRKGHIHIALSSHTPSRLSPGVLANCSNKIVFPLTSGKDREAMQKHMGTTVNCV